jgi:sugar phosphate isomerase/epimerase
MSTGPKIAIGNQTSFAAPTATFPFEYAVAHSFDAFEFFPDRGASGAGFGLEDLSAEMRRDVANRAVAAGIRVSVHAPWNLDPLRRTARAQLEQVLHFTADLGGRVMVLHLQAEQGMGAFARAIGELIEPAVELKVRLAIENTVETPPELFNELFDRLRSSFGEGVEHCGMCFDMGHANLQGAFRNDYLGYLDALGPQVPIIHAHLHENWGDHDSHLTLFTGPAGQDVRGVEGLVRRLVDRGFAGSCILEQWPDPPHLLDAARDRLRSLVVQYAAAP